MLEMYSKTPFRPLPGGSFSARRPRKAGQFSCTTAVRGPDDMIGFTDSYLETKHYHRLQTDPAVERVILQPKSIEVRVDDSEETVRRTFDMLVLWRDETVAYAMIRCEDRAEKLREEVSAIADRFVGPIDRFHVWTEKHLSFVDQENTRLLFNATNDHSTVVDDMVAQWAHENPAPCSIQYICDTLGMRGTYRALLRAIVVGLYTYDSSDLLSKASFVRPVGGRLQ